MTTLVWILLIVLTQEIILLCFRLLLHQKSANFQKTIKLPRIHHSVAGGAMLFLFWILPEVWIFGNGWIFILGMSLVISDGLHHFLIIPILKRTKSDINMASHPHIHQLFRHILGVAAIIVGGVALLTPLTPGSWLIPTGLGLIVGKKRAYSLLKKLMGPIL